MVYETFLPCEFLLHEIHFSTKSATKKKKKKSRLTNFDTGFTTHMTVKHSS